MDSRQTLKIHKCAKSLQSVRLLTTPFSVAHQVPLSMGFSKQAYWSGLPWPPPGDLPSEDTDKIN